MDISRETATGRGEWSSETDEQEPAKPDEEITAVAGARVGAQLIDIAFLAIQFIVVLTALQSASGVGGERALLYSALTLPLYGALLEGVWNGRTVGKRLLKIKVIDGEGPPSLLRASVRNLSAVLLFGAGMSPAAVAAGSVVPSVTGLAVMKVSDRRQRLLDHIAGTYVVAADESVTDPETKRFAADRGGGTTSFSTGPYDDMGGDGGDGGG